VLLFVAVKRELEYLDPVLTELPKARERIIPVQNPRSMRGPRARAGAEAIFPEPLDHLPNLGVIEGIVIETQGHAFLLGAEP